MTSNKNINPKTIITCALTGGTAVPRKHPRFPVTPQQIAEQGLEAAAAGAAVLHIHVRDPETGAPSNSVAHYREVVERIREGNSDVIINLTTGYGCIFVPTPGDWTKAAPGTNLLPAAERVQHIVELKPDICTLDMNTQQLMNVMSGEKSTSMVVMNLEPVIVEMARLIRGAGVVPEIEIFESGDLARSTRLIETGVLEGPGLFTLVLSSNYGLPATTASMSFAAAALPHGCIWTGMGIGPSAFAMAAQSYLLGGHVRIGLEDNIYLSRGEFAPSNAALVERVKQIVGALGADFASAAEARQIMGLRAV